MLQDPALRVYFGQVYRFQIAPGKVVGALAIIQPLF